MITRAIKVDPFSEQVTVLHKEFTPREMMSQIGSYDLGRIDLAPGLVLVCDEMGAHRIGQRYTTLGNFPLPLPGKYLLMGVDDEGTPTDVRFVSAATVDGMVVWVPVGEAQYALRNANPEPIAFESLPMPLVPVNS